MHLFQAEWLVITFKYVWKTFHSFLFWTGLVTKDPRLSYCGMVLNYQILPLLVLNHDIVLLKSTTSTGMDCG